MCGRLDPQFSPSNVVLQSDQSHQLEKFLMARLSRRAVPSLMLLPVAVGALFLICTAHCAIFK